MCERCTLERELPRLWLFLFANIQTRLHYRYSQSPQLRVFDDGGAYCLKTTDILTATARTLVLIITVVCERDQDMSAFHFLVLHSFSHNRDT